MGVRLCVSINMIVASLDHEDPQPVIPTVQLSCCAQPERPQRAADLTPEGEADV